MTDPDSFKTNENIQAIADDLETHELRLAADFRINKWEPYTWNDCIIQDDVLTKMQARGEVWYVEDAQAVYFIAGSLAMAVERLEEAFLEEEAA